MKETLKLILELKNSLSYEKFNRFIDLLSNEYQITPIEFNKRHFDGSKFEDIPKATVSSEECVSVPVSLISDVINGYNEDLINVFAGENKEYYDVTFSSTAMESLSKILSLGLNNENWINKEP